MTSTLGKDAVSKRQTVRVEKPDPGSSWCLKVPERGLEGIPRRNSNHLLQWSTKYPIDALDGEMGAPTNPHQEEKMQSLGQM